MKVGDSIKIIDGIIDPDTGIQLDGFVGRIKEYLASNLAVSYTHLTLPTKRIV